MRSPGPGQEAAGSYPEQPVALSDFRFGQRGIDAVGERTDVVAHRAVGGIDHNAIAAKMSIVWPRILRRPDSRAWMNTFVTNSIFISLFVA